MNGTELLRIVDAIHRDKNIDKEIVIEGIEQAIVSAARKHFGEEHEIEAHLDRTSGQTAVKCDGKDIDADELGIILGRISAQTAKQVMIQKIREAERDSLFDEFADIRGQIVTGTVTRVEGGMATVNLGKVEALLPRSEQIQGESYRVSERVRAVVLEVRKAGSRVKIILSRTHPDFVRRLFELEIPEVAERVIEVRSLAREAGYRSKVAVSCIDSNIDAVGACVGVRGSRIKNITGELGDEKIDIVRWNDSLQVLVPNALAPAEVEEVILCPMLGRVIVLVRDDQLSLAIGKRGQNVRLASKLVGWDIEVMTREELNEALERAVGAFSQIPGVEDGLAEELVSQGFLSFDDLSVIEPDQLAELGSLSQEQTDEIVAYAERESERLEDEERKRRAAEREQQQLAQHNGAAAAPSKPASEAHAAPAAEGESQPEAVAEAATSAESESAEAATEEPAGEAAAAEGEAEDKGEEEEPVASKSEPAAE
jgi:N utilization substance protein A